MRFRLHFPLLLFQQFQLRVQEVQQSVQVQVLLIQPQLQMAEVVQFISGK